MDSVGIDVPIGVSVARRCCGRCLSCTRCSPRLWEYWNKMAVLGLTFLSYTCYHMARKPISVVKNVLHQNCTDVHPTPGGLTPASGNDTTWCDWAPFDEDDAVALLGTLDSAFLFAYAVAMFVSGFVAERVNLRYFLAMGMILSGLFSYLFGLARTLEIHSLSYFIVIQIFMGIFQTTGWPAVVAIVGHWFGKSKRGFIFGVWNSHTSIGNILGSLIAGYYVETNWGYSFMMPGLIMALVGFLIFLLLVTHPQDVGCSSPESNTIAVCVGGQHHSYSAIPTRDSDQETDDAEEHYPAPHTVTLPYRRNKSAATEESPILQPTPDKAIGLVGALKIPGVIEFSMSLFFSKLVSYTFLFWLPTYIKNSTSMSPALSAELSTLFDVGGIVGAIVAGLVSDMTGMSAATCVVMLIGAVPSLLLYQVYGASSETVNIILLMVSGAFVNGPYALITTAVSAELGTHESLHGNAKALATVTAIIDGTGSIGAAVGPLIAGLVSPVGWDYVFYLLMGSDVIALILLARLTYNEVKRYRDSRRTQRIA